MSKYLQLTLIERFTCCPGGQTLQLFFISSCTTFISLLTIYVLVCNLSSTICAKLDILEDKIVRKKDEYCPRR